MLTQRIQNITHGWEMQGWKKGAAAGRKKGRKEGERHLVLELFATKFNRVPDWVRQRVASATKGELESWAKRLLTAASPEEVFLDHGPSSV